MAKKNNEGVFANIIPGVAEQLKVIDYHRSMLERSLAAPMQILTPPVLKNQKFPTRVILTRNNQQTFIQIPRKAEYFEFHQILIGYPPDITNSLMGPVLEIKIEGNDRDNASKFLDVRNFTSPNVTNPDPATPGESSNYKGSYEWNTLYPNDGIFRVTIKGFDGTNPEFVDIACIGKAIFDRKLIKSGF